MAFPRLSLSLLLLALVGSYPIDGSWELSPSPSRPYLSEAVTFQFKREADLSSTAPDGALPLSKHLYVYSCFLAQFLFTVEADSLRAVFITASLLSENCPIAQIESLKQQILKTSYFSISFNQLQLMDLAERSIYVLQRQIIPYNDIIQGYWLLTSGQARASSLAVVNATAITLCAGTMAMGYYLTLTNGSYPLLHVQRATQGGQCLDSAFGDVFAAAGFITVGQDRKEIVLYDSALREVARMAKVAGNSGSSSSSTTTTTPQSSGNNPNSGSFTGQYTSSSSSSSSSTTSSSSSSSTYTSPPSQNYYSPSSQYSSSQSTQGQAGQTMTGSSSLSSSSYQQTGESSSYYGQAAPTNSQNSNNPGIPSNSSSLGQNNGGPNNYGTTSSSVNYGTTQQGSSASSSTANSPSSSTTATSPSSSPGPSSGSSSNGQSSSSSYSQGGSSFSDFFSFVQDGSFSFNSFDSSNNNANSNTQNNVNANSQNTQNTQNSQNTPTAASPTPAPITYSSSQAVTLSSSTSSSSPPQTVTLQVPISQFVLQAKWLLLSLKGLTRVSDLLVRTYLIFTADRIVLYCPCNTFYTEYKLLGNLLLGLSWSGTRNQCQNSQDNLVTDLLFYSKIVKQEGQRLGFYYSEQVKMAEFQPFF